MYFGLEVIQEYACGGENVFCEAERAMVREFLHGGRGDQVGASTGIFHAPSSNYGTHAQLRYPEAVAMVTYDLMPTEVPYGEPPAPPTSVNPQVYHYLHDVLGSVIGVVNEAGTLVEQYTYDPYGKVLIEKWGDAQGSHWVSAEEPSSGLPYSPIGNPFMWTGHRYDSVAGLYYTKFRFYEPVLGRWLQRDPIEYEGGSINLYEYVLSSPVVLHDPYGLQRGRPTQPPRREVPPPHAPGSAPGASGPGAAAGRILELQDLYKFGKSSPHISSVLAEAS